MAGIGFELQKLSARNTLFAQFSAAAHGAVVATGPWLFTIASLALIALATEHLADRTALSTFRVVVFYGFCLSFIASSPAIITGVRLVADAIYAKKIGEVPGIFLNCLLWAALPTAMVGFVVYFVIFNLPWFSGITAIATCILTSLVWVATAFCSAIRNYRIVTLSFLFGMITVTINAVLMAELGQGTEGMLIGMNIGLCTIAVSLINQIFVTFPHPVNTSAIDPVGFARKIASRWVLCAGATAASLAIWVDKVILWTSGAGETVQWGLRHAPIYDSALFVSFLCIVPALAQYVVHIETDFYRRYQKYYHDISNHACLNDIKQNAENLQLSTQTAVLAIWYRHIVVCSIAFLLGPAIVSAIGLEYKQLTIFRMGVLGALFHFFFFACTSIILFLDRQRLFLGLQTLFLVTNLSFTMISLLGGESYLGTGYFAAILGCAVLSYFAMLRVLADINYLTFIANNKL
ncbi:MAG: exopolysaccharide Pel transporter PelG [Hyphomicrobiaceae bacterium]